MNKIIENKKLSQEHADQLLITLKERFEKNMNRHKDIKWDDVEEKLKTKPKWDGENWGGTWPSYLW